MSAVSSIAGNAQNLYSFIQSLGGASQSQAASATSGTSSASTSSQPSVQSTSGGGHRHHHHGGALQQIQNAVTTALQSAQSTGSASDPNQIVENAIAKVMGNNNAAVSSQSDSTGDADNDTTTGGSSSTQSFFQTLQSYGVSPEDFQNDLLSAVKDAQNGTSNAATAFQNFPVGSFLNTTA